MSERPPSLVSREKLSVQKLLKHIIAHERLGPRIHCMVMLGPLNPLGKRKMGRNVVFHNPVYEDAKFLTQPYQADL